MRQLLVIVSSLVMSGAAFCTEIHVPADQPSIQAGINAAVDGDTVIISPGRYVENIDFLGKAITVRSTDPLNADVVAATIIDGNQSRTCVTFRTGEDRDSVISGFTITNGGACCEECGGGSGCGCDEMPLAGGILCDHFIELTTVFIHRGSFPTICNNHIVGNSGRAGGGIYACVFCSPLIADNIISWNTCTCCYGGGLGTAGSATVVRNVFEGNSANSGGGAISFMNTSASDPPGVISGNTIIDNQGWMGSAIFLNDVHQHLLLQGNLVAANGPQPVEGSVSTIDMGAAHVEFVDNMLVGNYSPIAAWVFCCGTDFIMDDNIISGNAASCGICLSNTPGTVTNNTIIGNTGRGVGLDGGEFLANNIVAGNSGPGIRVSGPACLLNETVVDNGPSLAVGGILQEDSVRSSFVRNCIVQGNGVADAKQMEITYWNSRCIPKVSVDHCNIEGGIDSIDVQPGATLSWGPGNIDADPRFVRPGRWDDAGTPDDTSDDVYVPGDYRLLPGSPCIDAGTNDIDNPDTAQVETLPATDLAGVKRIVDGDFSGAATVDIGAYEFLPGDADGDGRVSVLDFIRIRNSLGLDPSSSPDARLADVNGDGSVNMVDLLLARRQFQGR